MRKVAENTAVALGALILGGGICWLAGRKSAEHTSGPTREQQQPHQAPPRATASRPSRSGNSTAGRKTGAVNGATARAKRTSTGTGPSKKTAAKRK